MIDFYGGLGTFAAWPERVRDYVRQTTAVNILDWRTAYGVPLSAATLATVEFRHLYFAPASHPAIRRANERVAEGIANASRATLAGAAHFMISTHPKEVAGMIAGHVAGVETQRAGVFPPIVGAGRTTGLSVARTGRTIAGYP